MEEDVGKVSGRSLLAVNLLPKDDTGRPNDDVPYEQKQLKNL